MVKDCEVTLTLDPADRWETQHVGMIVKCNLVILIYVIAVIIYYEYYLSTAPVEVSFDNMVRHFVQHGWYILEYPAL